MFIRDRGDAAQIQAIAFCVERELINSIRPTACCEQLKVRQERKKYGDAPGDQRCLFGAPWEAYENRRRTSSCVERSA